MFPHFQSLGVDPILRAHFTSCYPLKLFCFQATQLTPAVICHTAPQLAPFRGHKAEQWQWIIYRTVSPWHLWPSKTGWWSLAWTLLYPLSMNMELCCNQASKIVKVSLGWETVVEILVCGGVLGWLYHSPTNLPREACIYSGGSNHSMTGSISMCRVTAQNAILGTWKTSLIPTLQKQLSQTTGLVSETW